MASKSDLVVTARMLYIQGASIEDVAVSLGRSESTVYRWKDAEAKAGVSWDERRARRKAHDPQALITLLEGRRMRLAERDPADLGEHATQADALQKLSRTIQMVRESYGDYTLILDALHRFAQWALENRTDDRRAELLADIEAFTEDLKRSAT